MTPGSKRIRAYLDTSVIGGVHDSEFAEASSALFNRVRAGEIVIVLSEVVVRELAGAPQNVRETLASLSAESVELLSVTAEAVELAQAYVAAGVLTEKWMDDAMHVALATVARCDVLTSWNFKHLVRFDRSRGFNAVNIGRGYPLIQIASPPEVLYADREEEEL